MVEQVTATPTDAAVAPESPTSWDDKLASKLGLTDPTTEQEPEAAVEATPEGELAPEDVAPEEAAPETEGEWLELDRKGEKRKVSKEEAKRLAQQGWDYSTNQEQLKAERAILAQEREAVATKAQLTPLVIEAAGNVKYFERALAQYQNFNWVEHAKADPLGYQATKAQFDQLKDGYQQAVYQFQQASGAVQQADQAITTAELQQQYSRVLDEAPDLRDQTKYKAEAQRMSSYLRERGVTDDELSRLADSRFFLIARDAMRYREAMKARAERQQNTTAPALKPGPAPVRQTAGDKARETVKQLHQAKDPAQKKALFDKALAAKLERLA